MRCTSTFVNQIDCSNKLYNLRYNKKKKLLLANGNKFSSFIIKIEGEKMLG